MSIRKEQQLLDACERGELQTVRKLIERKKVDQLIGLVISTVAQLVYILSSIGPLCIVHACKFINLAGDKNGVTTISNYFN